ncbi:hypothetical protein [Acinetobacter silvestris]|uniref:Uncharacterized protein n=1 Tax=Acinetobacter silvestris TaxID=1977882 RepID=A0A1Y3CFK8_9GAMM|nr:hypothetical protein [Acinetobacter silvestris]OTG65891.1 hypothetical protein B9T28_06735 [Acinetobacter silvestris]
MREGIGRGLFKIEKVKLVNVAKNVKYNGINLFKKTEINQQVDSVFKQELLDIMSTSIQEVDTENIILHLLIDSIM